MNYIKVISLAIISFILISCEELATEDNIKSSEFDILLKETISSPYVSQVDTIIVTDSTFYFPKGYVCGIKDVTTWVFDHYESNSNKTLILWPEPGGNLNEYLNIYGFTGLVVNSSDGYDYAVSIGYSPNEIIHKLSYNSTMPEIFSVISNSNANLFYVDEPLKNNRFSIQQLVDISYQIHVQHPSGKLLLGSYTLPDGWYAFPIMTFGQAYNRVINAYGNVQMMCDQYDGDQRYIWEQFNNYYGSNKVFGHYIHSRRDKGDFGELIDKANLLNLYKLAFFHGSDGYPSETSNFAYNAWLKGWLIRLSHKQIIEYHCLYSNPCDCDPDLPCGWYVYKVWDFPNDLRIENPGGGSKPPIN